VLSLVPLGIYVYKFIAPEIYLGDSSFSGDISLSPTKGAGPLVRASSPTITALPLTCYGVGGTRGAARRIAEEREESRDFFHPSDGGNRDLYPYI
jgi:hypothetical protein